MYWLHCADVHGCFLTLPLSMSSAEMFVRGHISFSFTESFHCVGFLHLTLGVSTASKTFRSECCLKEGVGLVSYD